MRLVLLTFTTALLFGIAPAVTPTLRYPPLYRSAGGCGGGLTVWRFGVPLAAQDKPAVAPPALTEEQKQPLNFPRLTEVQKLTLQNLLKDIEIAQLKAQQAQIAFDAARAEITKTLQTLQVSGYTLNLQTLLYDPVPPDAKPETTK